MPLYTDNSSYTPADYSVGTRGFWGTLFDDHWIPSPVFCRLVDSLFFYANVNCNIAAMKNTGKMEFTKILDIRAAIAGEAALAKLPYTFWVSLYRRMWDTDGVGYSVITDADGCEHPTLNRADWLTSCVRDVQYDPDVEHRSWNKIVYAFKLTDPQTGLPFPTPIPRISFPLSGLRQSGIGRDRAAAQFLRGLVLEHMQTHIQYLRLSTRSGAINCDKCGQVIRGIRYKCEECFDFDECEICFRKPPLNAGPPTSPTDTSHQVWHKIQRVRMNPGSRACNVCLRSSMDTINRCLNCPDYDECARCFRARGYTGVRVGAVLAPANHRDWHTFLQSYVQAGTYRCDGCGRTSELIRNHCQFCPDYDECESCRRIRVPQPSSYPGATYSPPFAAPINPGDPPVFAATFNPESPVSTSPVDQQPPRPPVPYQSPGQLENIARIASSVVGLGNLIDDKRSPSA